MALAEQPRDTSRSMEQHDIGTGTPSGVDKDAKVARKRAKEKAALLSSKKGLGGNIDPLTGIRRPPRRAKSADYGYGKLFARMNDGLVKRRGKRRPKNLSDGSCRLSAPRSYSDSVCFSSSQNLRTLLSRSAHSFKRPKWDSPVDAPLSQSQHSQITSDAPRLPRRRLSNDFGPADKTAPRLPTLEANSLHDIFILCPRIGSSGHSNSERYRAPRRPSRRPSNDGTLPTYDVNESFTSIEYSWPEASCLTSKPDTTSSCPRKPRRRLSNGTSYGSEEGSKPLPKAVSEISSLILCENEDSSEVPHEYIFEDPYQLIVANPRTAKHCKYRKSGNWLLKDSFHIASRNGSSIMSGISNDDSWCNESAASAGTFG